MIAYKISQECHNVEHVTYEKNAGIGGTYVTLSFLPAPSALYLEFQTEIAN